VASELIILNDPAVGASDGFAMKVWGNAVFDLDIAGGVLRTSTRLTMTLCSDETSPRICRIIHPEGK